MKKKLSFRSVPNRPRIEKFKKIVKKIQKTKKHHYGFISSENRLGEAEKERKKKLSFRSVPTRPEIENSKKIAKKFKKLKNIIMASFQAKTGWETPRKREKKNYRSHLFLPDPE